MPPRRKTVAKRAKATTSGAASNDDSSQAGKGGSIVVEILEGIFRILSDKYFEQVFVMLNEDYHTGSKRKWGNPLVACSRVNKHWNAIAHRLLYRVVVITKPESMHLFLRSIKSKKALVGHVDSFSLDYRYKDIPTQPERAAAEKQKRQETSKATWEVVKLLKGLYHFGVSTYSLEPAPKGTKTDVVPNNILKGLKSLSIREDVLCRKTYAHWVKAAAPTLERLRCPLYTTQDSFLSTCAPTRNLRSLCLVSGQSWKFLDLMLGADGEAHAPIEDLSLPLYRYDDDNDQRQLCHLLKRVATTLRRLHIGIGFSDIDKTKFMSGLADALQLAPRLHEFSLLTYGASPGAVRHQLHDALPSTLCDIHLGQSYFNPPLSRDQSWEKSLGEARAILDRVEQAGLPELRTISIGADKHSIWSGDRKSDPERNSPERMANERRQKQLLKEAAQLGVNLEFLEHELPDQLSWFYVNSK